MTLGQKIKNRREELKMTQTELAGKAGTSQAYISRLERDGFNPTAPVAVRLASALKTSIDDLLLEERRVS